MRTAVLIAALALAPGLAPAQEAAATLSGPDGAALGEVTLTRTADGGVLIRAELTGLPPGAHGFHIHEVGACTPDFAAAGDHYNPDGKEHGHLNPAGHHAGDLPNVTAGADGTATVDVLTAAVSLDEGAPATLFDADGSAIIVHENADSYGPEAGAGGRLACGVIEAL